MEASTIFALKANADFIKERLGLDFIPRRIMPPTGYISPQYWWTTAVTMVLGEKVDIPMIAPPDLKQSVQRAIDNMGLLNAPTYFPSRALIDALDNTDVGDVRFEDIRFPAESMMFVLPYTPPYMPYTMEHDGKELTVAPVIVTLCRYHGYLTASGVNITSSSPSLGTSPVLEGTLLDSKGDMGWVRVPCTGAWSDTMTKYAANTVYDCLGIRVDPKDSDIVRKDIVQTQWAFRMAVKILIAMNTIGDVHIPEIRKVRDANPKRGKKELWQGQVMTLSRAMEGDAGFSTHASPRFHLRRGHMRQQRHGERNALVKTVWIKPTWVGTKDRASTAEGQSA